MVLYSTKQSLENREVSFLAIIEIILATIIYWFIAIYLNTYIHIWISIIVAPFLLLRSNSSIKMGLSLFENGVRSKRMYTLFYRFMFEMLILSIVTVITYILFERLINLNDIISILFFLLFCSGIGVGIGLGLFGVNDNQRIGILSIITVVLISIYLGGSLVFYVVLFTFLTSIIVLFIFKKIGEIVLGIILATFLGLGVALGLLFMIFVYKLVSIISNFSEGYKNIIQNWKYNNFMLDIVYPPELMYGIEKYKGLNEYKLSNFYTELKKTDGIIESFGVAATYIILYPFSIFYRFSIKATFWFYIPLLFIVKTPNLEDSNTIGKFLSELYQTVWAWIRVLLAAITIGAFIVTYFQYYAFTEVSNIPFVSIISMLYLDFSSIEIWKIFQLFVAVLTIGLFLYSNAIRVPSVANEIPLKKDYRVKIIYYANSFRNWISLFYFTSAFIFLAYYFKVWEYPYMPHFMESLLSNLVQYIQYKPFG